MGRFIDAEWRNPVRIPSLDGHLLFRTDPPVHMLAFRTGWVGANVTISY